MRVFLHPPSNTEIVCALASSRNRLYWKTAITANKVCALYPRLTYSEFHDVNGAPERVSKMAEQMWMDAERVVHEGLDAIERGRALQVLSRHRLTLLEDVVSGIRPQHFKQVLGTD